MLKSRPAFEDLKEALIADLEGSIAESVKCRDDTRTIEFAETVLKCIKTSSSTEQLLLSLYPIVSSEAHARCWLYSLCVDLPK